jgi:hypothetical protein
MYTGKYEALANNTEEGMRFSLEHRTALMKHHTAVG